MEKGTIIVAFSLFLAIVAPGCKQSEADTFAEIDLKGDYPEKEWVVQDFMDVEYIPLETSDEFITQGAVQAVGDRFVLVTNYINDGNIFVFDRKTGKGIRKINKKGQGAEEYAFINGIVLDEDKDEMFVNSSGMKKIFVYDLRGNFKRSFRYAGDAQYLEVYGYDKENLICYDMSVYYKGGEKRDKDFYHALISKQDGSVTKGIPLPFDIIKTPLVKKGDAVAVASIRAITPDREGWLLADVSSDTVYCYATGKNKLVPFLVKKPTENPEMFLTVGLNIDRYCYMQAIGKEFNFEKGRGFPTTNLMYDRQEKTVFKPIVCNADYVSKQGVDLISRLGDHKVATYQTIAADRLVEAYGKNDLKGELKEIASGLDEESNPVVMVMKYKE